MNDSHSHYLIDNSHSGLHGDAVVSIVVVTVVNLEQAFLCEVCVCVGFLWILQLPPTAQRHAQVNWSLLAVCRCEFEAVCLPFYLLALF